MKIVVVAVAMFLLGSASVGVRARAGADDVCAKFEGAVAASGPAWEKDFDRIKATSYEQWLGASSGHFLAIARLRAALCPGR